MFDLAIFSAALIGGVFVVWFLLVALFTPHIPYHVETDIDATSERFVHVLESMCQTRLEQGNSVEVLTDFYAAMLDAIRGAEDTINLECYIFETGAIGDRFVDALCERARAGVRVSVVLDAVGTFGGYHAVARPLIAAGCRVECYQQVTWYRLGRLNNRTHREMLVVDARTAFVGGAGIADRWAMPFRGTPMWRDIAIRVQGPIVSDIQGVIAENWLECRGEMLTGPETFRRQPGAGRTAALVVRSSPSDRATPSRVLFQSLIEGAQSRVLITTPYFLPDKAFRDAIVRTVRRGVEMRVIVPGPTTDQRWVRLASRRMYGQLLDSGVRIFEYSSGMIHAKVLVVDDLWAVMGSTNLDNRSFEHNDEVNVAVRDQDVARRVELEFAVDQANSEEVTPARWQARPAWERLVGRVAWILERQQ